MNKKDLFFGFVFGLLACMLGIFLFLTFFTTFNFISGLQSMKAQGSLGKLITLGAILDLVLFGVLIQVKKELMARGVLLSVIVLAIATLLL
jgi:hypothetical protein